jgi:hypothetical protein
MKHPYPDAWASIQTEAPLRIVAAALLVLTAALAPAYEAPKEGPETFIATVVSTSSAAGAVTDKLTLRVERWTPAREAQVLFDLLGRKGMEAFHKALNEQHLGSLASESRIGWPINMALEDRIGGERFIRLILERPTLGSELATLQRSADYPFVVVEFTLAPGGKGTGRVVPAAKLRLGPKGELEILPYQEPDEQRIIGVKRVKP